MKKPILWKIPDTTGVELACKIQAVSDRLQWICQQHQAVRFASSLAVEDLVITDLIAKLQLPIAIFTLDTGLLPPATLALFTELERYYPQLSISCFQPKEADITQFITQHGKFAFYDSVELRKKCCFLRKIAPLNQALQGADAWLTGQRREQSITRTALTFAEQDQLRQMAKYNPIFDWTEKEVWAYVLQHHLPFNAMYQQGFASIGCEPCTAPVKAGEDIRTGRWWWESRESKECGLHK